MPEQRRIHRSVRLVIHTNPLDDRYCPWSLALVEDSRLGATARWLQSGVTYLPGLSPSEPETWETVLELADWHGRVSRY